MKTKLILIAIVFLAVNSANAKKETSVKAICVKADQVTLWEQRYCATTTGSTDYNSEVAVECLAATKKKKEIPKKGCARIIWLKTRACVDQPAVGFTKANCLRDKDYLSKEDEVLSRTGVE